MFSFGSNVDEYFPTIDEAVAGLKSLGYTKIVLWGNSTGGLTLAHYLAARRSHLDEALAGAVFDSPFWQFQERQFGQIHLDAYSSSDHERYKFGHLSITLRAVARCVSSLLPQLILAKDPDCIDPETKQVTPTWMDHLATNLGREARYCRSATPCRSKPMYAGYVGGAIKAHAGLQDKFLGPWFLRCVGLDSLWRDAPLPIPSLLLTTPQDVGQPGYDGVAEGVDDHIDTVFVRDVFPRYFGNAHNRSLTLAHGFHEMLQAREPTLVQILAELKALLERDAASGSAWRSAYAV